MNNVVPYVTFYCSRQNKMFCLPRESIIHTESLEVDDNGTKKVDDDRTYVRFKNPDPKGKPLHAVVDVSVITFRDIVIQPAWIETANMLAGTAQ